MLDPRRLIRENRLTAYMLLFVLLLYLAVFLAGLGSVKEPVVRENAFTTGELRQREETVRQNLSARPVLAASLSLLILAVVGAGLALDVYLVTRALGGHPWMLHLGSAEPRWGLRDLAQTFVFMLFVEGVLFIAQAFWYWSTGLEKMPRDIFLLGNSLVRDLCVAVFVWMLLRFRGQSWRELGFKTECFFQNVKTGVVGYIAVIPPMLLGFFLLAVLMQAFSYEPLPQNAVQIYLKKEPGAYLIFFTVFVAMLGPVLEEIFFRGFAYPALKKRHGAWKSMTLTAAVFAAFHMNAFAFLPIFFLGFFLTYLYESTGSLVPSITAHVLHNTLMVVMTLGFRALSGPA